MFKSDETSLALIGQIQVELTELLNLLNKINASEDVNEAIFLQVKKYLQGDGFNSKLRLLAKRSPEPLKSWLTDISVGVWAVAVKNTRNYINDVYIENVYSFYLEQLKKAEQIQEVIFKGGQKPEVNFSIKLNSVSKRVKQFGFQLDKQSGLCSTSQKQ